MGFGLRMGFHVAEYILFIGGLQTIARDSNDNGMVAMLMYHKKWS